MCASGSRAVALVQRVRRVRQGGHARRCARSCSHSRSRCIHIHGRVCARMPVVLRGLLLDGRVRMMRVQLRADAACRRRRRRRCATARQVRVTEQRGGRVRGRGGAHNLMRPMSQFLTAREAQHTDRHKTQGRMREEKTQRKREEGRKRDLANVSAAEEWGLCPPRIIRKRGRGNIRIGEKVVHV